MGLAKISPGTKCEVSSFTRSKFTKGGLKFAPLGVFFIHEMGLAKIYHYTKFEVSSLPVPNLAKGV